MLLQRYIQILECQYVQTYPHAQTWHQTRLQPRASSTSNPIRHESGPEHAGDRTADGALPGLELDETLGADFVQDAETALPTPDGVGGLDDVAGAAIAAAVLNAAEGRDGDGGGSGGGGCWFGHVYRKRYLVAKNTLLSRS